MTKLLSKKSILAIATLSGTIIGVGMFSLPYIANRSGFWILMTHFLLLGALVMIIHLFFGEISLKTPDLKRLPGFAKFHLGHWGEKAAYTSAVLGGIGALLAYLIIGGEFLRGMFFPIFGGSYFSYVLIFFAFSAVIIYFGIRAISKTIFWSLIAFFAILIFIFFSNHNFIETTHFFNPPNLKFLFLPYGAILFALWGTSIIPEVEEMLGDDKKLLKKIIFLSILFSALVYIFFAYFIFGITGPKTTQSALTGLINFIDHRFVILAYIFGFLTVFTSFISVGLTLKKVFWYDLKFEKKLAWIMACFIPLVLFIVGLNSFITVISLLGGVLLGIEGILILLMYKKLRPKNFFIYPLMLVFVCGIIYQIWYFFHPLFDLN